MAADLRDKMAEVIRNGYFHDTANEIADAVMAEVVTPEMERLREEQYETTVWHDEFQNAKAELERLHTWEGLLELLNEHWPEDIFPTEPDSETRDPGPRIVSLLRWVERLRTGYDRACESATDWRSTADAIAENRAALRAAIERAKEIARHPRTSQGRVKDYVDAADILAALDTPTPTEETRRIAKERIADVDARCVCDRSVHLADFDPLADCPIHTVPTEETGDTP